ncbi:MAG: hypothetical protein NVS3B21_04330 [Acidimicrobiales bacterium]
MELFESRWPPPGDNRQGRVPERKTVEGTRSVCGRGQWRAARARRSAAPGGPGPRPQQLPQLFDLIDQRSALEGQCQGLIVEAVQLGQETVTVDVEVEPIARRDPRGPSLGKPVVRVPHLPATVTHARPPFCPHHEGNAPRPHRRAVAP